MSDSNDLLWSKLLEFQAVMAEFKAVHNILFDETNRGFSGVRADVDALKAEVAALNARLVAGRD